MKHLHFILRGTPPLLCGTLSLSVLASLVLFGGSFRATASSELAQAGCGTMKSTFGKDQCLRLSFNGEVSASQSFERRFTDKLLFRLNAKTAASGWIIEVIPEGQDDDALSSEYVWVVNPPYRYGNVRYLDTSYGTSAKKAVADSPRDFNFVLNEQQFKYAADLVEMAIMSRPQSDTRSKEEIERESDAAIESLFALHVAKGRLAILDSRVAPSVGEGDLGSIAWLKFKVELHVPCDLISGATSAEVSVDRTRCSSERKQNQK
jgi:hypothetical protein